MISALDQETIVPSEHSRDSPPTRGESASQLRVANGGSQRHAAFSSSQIRAAQDRDRWDMARLANGEMEALDSLMQRHAKSLSRQLERMVRNHSDAQDLANETFLRVFQHRQDYNCEAQFSTWFYVISSHLAINLLRWRKRHLKFDPLPEDAARCFSTDSDALIDPAPTPREQAERDEWMDALEQALAKLPAQLREPLLLVALDGCSQAEVAARLGCTVKAVETRLYHGRKRLRAELDSILNPWHCRVQAAIRVQSLR